jgi:aspartyl-tRNA(Asn)/glutamyl-tRNA(Gln) amidotransferase subunit B
VGEGEVLVEMGDGTARTVRIERIHLEQDAGKSIHDMDPATCPSSTSTAPASR